MKIAVWHNLPSGGGKRALYYHLRGLLERGHAIESWCPPTADRSYLALNELVREQVISLTWRSAETTKRRFPAVSASQALIANIKAMMRHCQKCAEQMHQRGFDVLFANACMFFRVPPIARYAQIPSVLYLGEPYRWLYEALPRLPWAALPSPESFWWSPRYLKRWLDDLIRVQGLRVQVREEMHSAQAFASILVNSLFSRESVLRAYGLDAKVCYLGIDTKLFLNQKKERENIVVGVGALVPEKNVEFIIRALAHVKQPRPRLVWVANLAAGAYVERLMKLAEVKEVDFEPKVRIPDSELVDILNRGLLLAYAPRLEPFGLAPLEANACGLPVVAVAEGGVRETVIAGVNGLLVEHEPEAMGSAMQQLVSDRRYASRLGENGCGLVAEQWSLEAAVDRLEILLTAAVRGDLNGKRG